MRRPTHERGVRRWTNSKGYLHRMGGPSEEMPYGDKQWHWNGALAYSEDSSSRGDRMTTWIKYNWKKWKPGWANYGRDDNGKKHFSFPGYDGQKPWRIKQWE